jgi:hypothetical protein
VKLGVNSSANIPIPRSSNTLAPGQCSTLKRNPKVVSEMEQAPVNKAIDFMVVWFYVYTRIAFRVVID